MSTSKKTLSLLLMMVVASVTGCSWLQNGKATGEKAVGKFHDQLNSGQFHEIYAHTDEGFRKATSEPETIAYLEAVHRKLGVERNAKQVGWRVFATTGGTQVSLVYETDFDDGKATEQFVFLVNGDEARLFKYNIQSPTLITK